MKIQGKKTPGKTCTWKRLSVTPTVAEEAAGLLASVLEQDCMVICEALSFSTEESAGDGVIDTGATRSIGSAKALELLHELAMTESGKPCLEVLLGKPQLVFKFGNGKTASTSGCVSLWVLGVRVNIYVLETPAYVPICWEWTSWKQSMPASKYGQAEAL